MRCSGPKPIDARSTLKPHLDKVATLTVVVPVRNDADRLRRLLPLLKSLGWPVVVSDGGSTDNSVRIAVEAGAHVVVGAANRGEQLARGALVTSSPWILFLHSDSHFDPSLGQQLQRLIAQQRPVWGRFDVELHPQSIGLRCVAWFMNQRSRLTKICTGDQGIFVHRALLDAIAPQGGMPCQPLMEDIELSKRLKRSTAAFVPLPGPLISSARRWRQNGVLLTVLSMWGFRLGYWLGKSPEALVRRYYLEPPRGKPG